MSIMSSAPLESHLTTPWDLSHPYPDIHTVMFGCSGHLLQHESQPQFWSKFQVWDWLHQIMDMHQIDASNVSLQNLDMDGHELCALGYQDFLLAAGSVGPILFHSLAELKWNGVFQNELIWLLSMVSGFHCLNSQISQRPMDVCDPSLPVASPASSSEIKRRMNRSCLVKKQSPRGTHLWEFIRDILLHPERNPGLIKWEDRTEGVFRFLKSEAVAQLWGRKKNNSSMTYEKLSRAMRYYYKREILERVDGRRLVYKFGPNARGWKEAEK
ncbi:ETS homologous factor [Eucyclogobius newberryi]|uniref:ETS homologous factor n=1 Tax=Eucyclogobius newberryi TaxID=166745 RepID=UPI003B5CB5BE